MYTKRVPHIYDATMDDLGAITDHLLIAITEDHPIPQAPGSGWTRVTWQNELNYHLDKLTVAINIFKRTADPRAKLPHTWTDYLSDRERLKLSSANQSLHWISAYSEFILTLPHWTEEPTH